MTQDDIERLKQALDRKDIPKWVQMQVFNAVTAPTTGKLPQQQWAALRAEIAAHIASMRGNKGKVSPAMQSIRKEYYDCVVQTHKAIRAYPNYTPIADNMTKWQEWIPKDVRVDLANRMRAAYKDNGLRGNHIIPFAPTAYRQDNSERIKRMRAAIAAERADIDPMETGKAETPVGALILAACRQAERAIDKYEDDLKDGTVHPYETPAKVNWRHYCTQAMRDRVKDALAGKPVSLDGLLTFYREPGTPVA